MKPGIKVEIIDTCRKKLLGSIENLQSSIRDLQEQANDYGQPKDRYDSFRTQLLRRRDMLAQQMAKELNDYKLLDKINPDLVLSTAALGSVIETDDLIYFLGIGLGKIETVNGTYYAISMQVPLAQSLMDRKAGDKIKFRDKMITLKSIT